VSKILQNSPLSPDLSTDKPLTEVVEDVIEPLFNLTNYLQQTLVLVRHLANQKSTISNKESASLQPIENKLVELINRIEKLEQLDVTSSGSQSEPISQSPVVPAEGSLLLAALNNLPEEKLRAHLKQAIPRFHDSTISAILIHRRNKLFSSTENLLHIKYMSENRLEQLTEYFAQPKVQSEIKPFVDKATSVSQVSSLASEVSSKVASADFSSSSAVLPALTGLILDAVNHLPEANLRDCLKHSIPRIHDTTINTIFMLRRKNPFSSIEELLNIKYISSNRLEQFGEYLSQPQVRVEVEPFLKGLAAPNVSISPKHDKKLEKKLETAANTAVSSANVLPIAQLVLDAVNQLPEQKLREYFKQAIPRLHDTTINAVFVQRRKKPFTSSKEFLNIKYMSESRLEQLAKYLTQAHIQAEVKPFLSTSYSTQATSTSSSPMSEERFEVADTSTLSSTNLPLLPAQFLLEALNQLPEKELREHFKQAIPRVHDTTVNAVLAQRRKKFFSAQEELIKIKYMSESRRKQLEEYFAQPQVRTEVESFISGVTSSSVAASDHGTSDVSSQPPVNEDSSDVTATSPVSENFVLDAINQLSEKELRNIFKQAIPRIHDTTVNTVITQRGENSFSSLQDLLKINYMSENRLEQLQKYLAQAEVQTEIKRTLAGVTVPASVKKKPLTSRSIKSKA
jgi:DNA uptake protein ComE-like DNA-binding protein